MYRWEVFPSKQDFESCFYCSWISSLVWWNLNLNCPPVMFQWSCTWRAVAEGAKENKNFFFFYLPSFDVFLCSKARLGWKGLCSHGSWTTHCKGVCFFLEDMEKWSVEQFFSEKRCRDWWSSFLDEGFRHFFHKNPSSNSTLYILNRIYRHDSFTVLQFL